MILEGVNGKVEVLEKVQGKKKFQKKTLEIIRQKRRFFKHNFWNYTYWKYRRSRSPQSGTCHQFQPKDVIVRYMGATMGTYAGKDGMIISF